MPKTAYLKSMDIWMLVSFSYTFLVLLEFCSVLALTMVNSGTSRSQVMDTKMKGKDAKRKLAAGAIERHCKVMFPVTYIIFIVLYFACNVNYEAMDEDPFIKKVIQELHASE